MYLNSWKHMQYIKIYDRYVVISNQREHELLNIFRNSCLIKNNITAPTHEILINRLFNKLTFPQYIILIDKFYDT
jgi:hypothetical protein